MIFETEYASERQLISWVLSWRENARLLDPPELAAEADERLALLRDRHRGEFDVAKTVSRPLAEGNGRRNGSSRGSNGRAESVIRPERFARLVTLAGLLIGAAREDEQPAHQAGARRAQHLARGAARGPRRAQRRQLRRRHLRPLRRDRRRPDRGRPRHLRRQLRPPGAPAAARGEGAGGRDRPVRRPPAAVGPADRAREDRRRARPRPLRRRASRSRPAATTPRSCGPSTTRSRRTGCSSSSTTRRTRTTSSSARSSRTSSSTGPRAGIWAASTSVAPTRATSGSTG